jgi:diguanylate cyclase (GGDEF)-like protein/PAS domain S-box-containing protein
LLGIAYQHDVGWFSLTLFNSEELSLINNKNIFIFISLFFIATLMILGFILKSLVVSPIEQLKALMIRVEKGAYDSDLPTIGSGEIAELSMRFNMMVNEIQEHNLTLEEKIHARTTDLRASEIKFRSLFNSTHDAIMLLNEKKFIDCNNATLKLFGCSTLEEFCKLHPANLSPKTQPCGSDSSMLALQHIQKALRDGYEHFKWIHQRADNGETFFADVLLSTLELGDKIVLQAVVRDESARRKSEEEIRTLAFYDSLTNLPNRRLLSDRLLQAQSISKRNGTYCAVLFMDLDNFKPLNDSYGHTIGDLLLIQVAQRIKACVRESDTVARFGGDEFIVLLSELSENKNNSITQVTAIAEKIRASLAHPYFLKIHSETIEERIVEHHCTASIGCTLFLNHDLTQDEIFNQADSAMYMAKENGRDRVHLYLFEK